MSDYKPLSPAWEAVLDITAENVPPTEPTKEEDEEIEIAEEIDKIIEILRGIDGGE